MKKINYFVLPLLVMPFLASCGSKCEKITEQEFNDAMAMKGVEYLQAHVRLDQTTIFEGETATETMNDTELLSPGVFYRVTEETNSSNKAEKTYDEVYSTGNKEACEYIERFAKDGKFSAPTHITPKDVEYYPDYFSTPQDFEMSSSLELSFKDFTYTNDGYVFNIDEQGMKLDISLFFANKRLTKYTLSTDMIEARKVHIIADSSVEFAYDKIVPADPSK
ncbi:MAG: hypothetical protein MJ207_01925 [Bacilli bacterium]|nr:hypothetical protein [Bacilli bacterium]